MLRRHSWIILALAATASVSAAPAGAQVDSVRVSRSEAVRRALEASPEVARRIAARNEAARLGRVPYLHNPEVSVEVEGTPAPWSSGEYTRRVLVEQELDLRGERRARVVVGQATHALVERELGEREQQIAAEVDRTFSRLLVARRKAQFLEPLRERARSLRARAERARQRETLTGFDARLLRAEALSLEADWLEAEREMDISASELRTWLALPADTALGPEDDLDERQWQCDVDSAFGLALQNRRSLERAAAAESLSSMRLRLEQRLGRVNPRLGLSVSRERLELEPERGGILSDEDTMLGLGLTLPIPIFGVNTTGVAQARLELERSRAERAALERQVRQDVVSACAGLHRAEEERRMRREAAASASDDLRLVESAYTDGRIPLEEFLTLRDRLVRQQIALLDAIRVVEEQRASLVQATGASRAELERRWGGR